MGAGNHIKYTKKTLFMLFPVKRTEINSITIGSHAVAANINVKLYIVNNLILCFLDLYKKTKPIIYPQITILIVERPISQSSEENSTKPKSPFRVFQLLMKFN